MPWYLVLLVSWNFLNKDAIHLSHRARPGSIQTGCGLYSFGLPFNGYVLFFVPVFLNKFILPTDFEHFDVKPEPLLLFYFISGLKHGCKYLCALAHSCSIMVGIFITQIF
jgi:hypothetical protein